MDKQLKLGLDLKGGVHLVLRVADRRCAAARDRAGDGAAARGADRRASIPVTQHRRARSDAVPRRRRAAGAGRARSAQAANEVPTQLRPQRRRQRHLHVHDEAEHRRSTCATRRWCRRGRRSSAASTSSASPSRASRSRAPTAIRSSCSCPASPTSSARRSIIRSTGLLELKIVEQGPSPTKEALLSNGQVPQGMDIVPGVGGTPGDTGTVVLPGAKASRRSPAATCATRGRRSTRTTSRRSASR